MRGALYLGMNAMHIMIWELMILGPVVIVLAWSIYNLVKGN